MSDYERIAGLPSATCYRTHTMPDVHLGVSGAVWLADVRRILAGPPATYRIIGSDAQHEPYPPERGGGQIIPDAVRAAYPEFAVPLPAQLYDTLKMTYGASDVPLSYVEGWNDALDVAEQHLDATPDALRKAAQETLGAFYVSPGVTTGRQAKALDALRAALLDRCGSVKPGTELRCMRQVGHHEPHQNTTVSAVESEWPSKG